jgi:small basic protein
MYLIILGLTLGLIIGGFLRIDIPPEYARYTAVAIVGVLDSLLGAIRASAENKYSTTVFISGLVFNMIIAVLITFIGDKLNLDIYLAILVAFTIRIFANIGIIKTTTVDKLWNKSNKIADKIEN